ncbi:MAG: hypothetical protein M1818_006365 [Claussenomyces sp. TS43310]|nr:MAG: hypothetical protein M1818_006365 [Claussenomyces sp. TS43310]
MVGKKKRGHPDVEEILARPWCYYCERDFDDLKILISHQKAKHFKCERCGRRLNTAGGLSVHMNQVHKETLTNVENALGNRAGLDFEIFGIEGIPEDVVQAHNQRIITQFYQAEAERRAVTGNPGPGGSGGGGASKKPKFESPAELKKRLAEHKARIAEQAAAGGSSGDNTPLQNGQSPGLSQSPGAFNGSPYAPPPVPYSGPPGANYGSYSQEPYSQPTPAFQQPPYSPQTSFSPPGGQYQPSQFQPPQQFPPQQSFPPPGYKPPGQFQPGPSYGAGPPAAPYSGYQAPPSHSPPPGLLPNRPPSLPQAPGLPQRPSFGTSPVPPKPMTQMRGPNQGPPGTWGGNGWNGPGQNPAMSSAYPPHSQGYNGNHAANASSVDELVAGASRPTDDIDEIIRMAEAGIRPPKKDAPPSHALVSAPVPIPASAQTSAPAAAQNPESHAQPQSQPAAIPETSEKKTKKEKDKNTRMVYSDNEVSPEEKMAKMPRYAFVPDGKDDTALVDANQAPAIAAAVDE